MKDMAGVEDMMSGAESTKNVIRNKGEIVILVIKKTTRPCREV